MTGPWRVYGDFASAVRLRPEVYKDAVPEIVTSWVIDDMDALPPYNQFALGAMRFGQTLVLRIGAISTGTTADPRVGLNGVRIETPPIAEWTFSATDDECVAVCAVVVSGLVHRRLAMAAPEHVWQLILDGYLHIEQTETGAPVGAVAADAAAGYPAPWGPRNAGQGQPQPAAGGTDAGPPAHWEQYRRGWKAGRADIVAERDELREQMIAISDAIELADPNNFPGPMSDAERITALGERAKPLANMPGRDELVEAAWAALQGNTKLSARNVGTIIDAFLAKAAMTDRPMSPNSRMAFDGLRKQFYAIEEAVNEADSVEYPDQPPPLVDRIRALGDRARQITDIFAGAAARKAEPTSPDRKFNILGEVLAERMRAEKKFPDQHLPDGTGEEWRVLADEARTECDRALQMGIATWMHVTREEVFEAFAETDQVKLRAEVLQIMAMGLRWVEDIDLRAADQSTTLANPDADPNANPFDTFDTFEITE